MRRIAPSVAALHTSADLESPTDATLRKAAAVKTFIEALAAEQQARVAAARAAREEAKTSTAAEPTSSAQPAPLPSSSSRRSTSRPSPSDYASLALIGRGAFGEVRLCVERATGVRVAVKALAKAEMRARGQVAHVRSERDALAASPLRACPFIVRLRATFQDAARLFLVMEFCPGGDLLTLLQRVDTLPPEAARFYAAQLTAAVGAIHAAGYVHRDIKPDNVLLDAAGHVKLSDFGLCTAVEWAGEAEGSGGGGGGGGVLTTALPPRPAPPTTTTTAAAGPPPSPPSARPTTSRPRSCCGRPAGTAPPRTGGRSGRSCTRPWRGARPSPRRRRPRRCAGRWRGGSTSSCRRRRRWGPTRSTCWPACCAMRATGSGRGRAGRQRCGRTPSSRASTGGGGWPRPRRPLCRS